MQGTHLLVDCSVEVVIYIQIHILSAVLLSDHDIFTIVFEGHRQGLTNARHTCCEVLAEDVLHTVCAYNKHQVELLQVIMHQMCSVWMDMQPWI